MKSTVRAERWITVTHRSTWAKLHAVLKATWKHLHGLVNVTGSVCVCVCNTELGGFRKRRGNRTKLRTEGVRASPKDENTHVSKNDWNITMEKKCLSNEEKSKPQQEAKVWARPVCSVTWLLVNVEFCPWHHSLRVKNRTLRAKHTHSSHQHA